MILSAVPMTVVLSGIIPYTGIKKSFVVQLICAFFPGKAEPYLIDWVSYIFERHEGMLTIAIIVAVWSAGRGMLFLIRGLNGVHGIVERRGYIKLRIIASFYTIVFVAGILFSLVVLVFGQQIYTFFLMKIPILREMQSLIFGLRYVLAVLFLSLLYTIIYTYVPDIKTSFKQQFFGGFLAAVGGAVFSYGFSVYVDYFNDFSSYGSINMIVLSMLWLYFTIYILLYGAYIGSRESDGPNQDEKYAPKVDRFLKK